MEIKLSDSERSSLRRFVEYTHEEIKNLTDQISQSNTPDSLLILEKLKNQHLGRLDGVMKVLTVLNIQL